MSGERADCAIVGADPAGLLLALLLARRGQRVTVVRPASGFERRLVGVSPFLSPQVLALLERLGLSAALVEAGQPVRKVVEYPVRGHPYVLDYGGSAEGAFGYALSVPLLTLTKVLRDAFAEETSVRVVDSGPVADLVDSDSGGVELKLAGWGTVSCRWVVAADGPSSKVRAHAGIDTDVLAFDRPLVMMVVPRPAAWPERIVAHHIGRDSLVTAIPLAEGRLIVQWLADPRELEEVRAAGIARLLVRVTGALPELAGPLAASVTGWERVRVIRHRLVRPSSWSRGNVGLIGDAAHGVHSFGGQGLSMGLQDAVVMAFCLIEAMANDGKAAPFALYERVRRPYVEHFQRYQASLPQLSSQSSPRQRGFLYEAIAHVMAKGQPEVEVHARRLLGETGDSGTATSRTKVARPGRPLSRITGDCDSGHTVGP